VTRGTCKQRPVTDVRVALQRSPAIHCCAVSKILTLTFVALAPVLHAADIFTACRTGNVEMARELIAASPELMYSLDNPSPGWAGRDSMGNLPMGLAIVRGDFDMVSLFLDAGYDVGRADDLEDSVLGFALAFARDGSEEREPHRRIFALILGQGFDVERRYPDGGTLLHDLDSDQMWAAERLLEAGVPVNGMNQAGDKAIDAIPDDELHAPLRQLLLAHGAEYGHSWWARSPNAQKLMSGLVFILFIFVLNRIVTMTSNRIMRTRSRVLLRCLALGLLMVAGGLWLGSGTFIRILEPEFASDEMLLAFGIVAFKFLPIFLIIAGTAFARRAAQLKIVSAAVAMKSDTRPPILYLRSFQDDASGLRRSFFRTLALWFNPMMALRSSHEEQLAAMLRKAGPVVAIGDPQEEVPELGAFRLYVSHNDWQQTVLDLMNRSQLVVWRPGHTEGVWWELENLIRQCPPERIVVYLPKENRRVARARNKELEQRTATLLPVPIPAEAMRKRFVSFTEDWDAEPHLSIAPILKKLKNLNLPGADAEDSGQ
jgi:hypothetical protein